MEERKMNELMLLLAELYEDEPIIADAIGLALAVRASDERVLVEMLKRKVEDLIEEAHSTVWAYQEAEEAPGEILETCPERQYDDELGGEDLFDIDEEEFEPESEEEESEEEEEPDELSERLGLDVDSALPIELAVAITRLSGGDDVEAERFIAELGARGKNMAQLATLVEEL
jgi:hypothetical protein